MSHLATLVYDGITSTAGWSFSFGVGISPSQAVIAMPATTSISSSVGDMELRQGSTSITFTDCRISRIVRTGSGNLMRVTIRDRRWKWQFGKVDGSYNQKKTVNGTETIKREKTPQELATLLLDAMNETGYDVTELPNVARPAAAWTAANPAQQLQSLCSSLGCLVILNALTDRVELRAIGSGGSLPSPLKRINGSSPTLIKAQPDQIRVIAGPSLFQSTIDLGEAVGIDTDGEIKPIDDLSYKPEAGWEDENPFKFRNISGTYANNGKTLNTIDLANGTVWRMYRITGLKAGGWSPQALAGTPLAPTEIDDWVIKGFQLRKAMGPDGEDRRQPAEVRGKFADKELRYDNSKDGTLLKAGFSVDNEQGIVTFSEPVFQYDNAAPSAADLTLEAAIEVLSNGIKVRHEEFRNANGQTYNAGPMLLRHPEIIRETIEGEGASDNLSDVQQEAGYYMDSVNQTFQGQSSLDATYVLIQAIATDGVNRQVTWSGGGQRPGTTRISQNQEHNSYTPTYDEQRKNAERDESSEAFTMTDPEAKR